MAKKYMHFLQILGSFSERQNCLNYTDSMYTSNSINSFFQLSDNFVWDNRCIRCVVSSIIIAAIFCFCYYEVSFAMRLRSIVSVSFLHENGPKDDPPFQTFRSDCPFYTMVYFVSKKYHYFRLCNQTNI